MYNKNSDSFFNQYWESPRGIMPNVFDCDILVSSNSRRAITFTFEHIPLEKA